MEHIKILHVEDDDGDAHLIDHALSRITNYQFNIIRNCRLADAIKYLDENKVDIILVDLSLPDSSGLESVTRLRTFSPDQAIVVITGTDDENLALEAVKNGAQDYLVKDELTPSIVGRAIRYSMERHKYDAEVVKLANFDKLTGIANRSRCLDYLEHALLNAKRGKTTVSLLFIDCDKFKLINDTLGHQAGDEFLIKIASTIHDCLRASDFVARLGGDEFIVVLDHEDNSLRSPVIVAEKILQSLRFGINLAGGEKVDARCSIGIASYSGEKAKPTADHLIHEADTAMYSAKRKGGDGFCFFDTTLEKQAERRIHLLRGLNQAFHKSQFSLEYQPVVNITSGIYEGMEALLRWKNLSGETVPPDEFVPLLEETGLIKVIGYWVIEQSCRDFRKLQQEGLLAESAWISVNVSPIQFNELDFVDRIKHIIAEQEIKPNQLQLEITESLLLDHGYRASDMIKELKAVGVKFAIDDFGVGYSSMAYLKDLPVDTLKIDKTFIQQCLDVESDAAITRAMVALAHNLNMKVVAEGVEALAVAQFLAGINTDYVQGFYYAKPMAMDDLRKFFKYLGADKLATNRLR